MLSHPLMTVLPEPCQPRVWLVEEVLLHPGPVEPLAPREVDRATRTRRPGASTWQA